MLDISVIVPVFNEEEHLLEELTRIRNGLDDSEFSYEIIVIDDGSEDGSAEVAAAFPGIRIIKLGRNRGSGHARRVGTRAACGRIVVWTDADMTYPNHQIADLVRQMGTHDHIVGARSVERGTLPWLRRPAKWAIRCLASYLVKTPIPDLNSGFRAFRRDVGSQFLDDLPSGFSCVTTMTMSFLSNGYSVAYAPIDYGSRAGHSKFHWSRDTRRYITQVIRLVMSYEPLRIFLPAAGLLLSIGVAKLAFDVATKSFRLGTNTLLLLIAGLQAIAIGFVADLVVRSTRQRNLIPSASEYEIQHAATLETDEDDFSGNRTPQPRLKRGRLVKTNSAD